MKSQLPLLIIGAILVCVVGFIAFTTFTDSISGPQSSAMMNATMNTGDTMFSMVGIVLVIGVAIGVFLLLTYSVRSQYNYEKLGRFFKFLYESLYYFGFGLLALVIVAVPGYFIWFLWNYAVIEGNTGSFVEVAKWIVIIIVAYIGISGLGFFFKKKFVDKLIERRKQTKHKENIKELPGTTE